ncbi:MAG: acr [Fluviicola sp.]|jgi:uncharacterized oxidoreductase|uniref:SDR family oxidoreductase n=1 Tax=Fluviicola sp. TaxID=1917219 RepID=UPI00261B6447|nr:SDR family NAD(P)-dependent oxidoreductase [Fluviicola sp.]MDF3029105.1 acr [Fluviicola sp.]
MNLSGNTILITGGSSGIGLELCKQLVHKKNTVIICGRSLEKLQEAKSQFPEVEIIQCDLADKKQCEELIHRVKSNYSKINVLINNAAIVNKIDFIGTENALEMAENEIAINFLAPLNLIKELYTTLQQNLHPNIITITTGLVYTPRTDYPFYCGTKAALHSFTQVLRKQTENDKVKITEVLFPSVSTPWHKGNPPKMAISPEKAVSQMLKGLEKEKAEIKVGKVKLLYIISRFAPGFAFKKVNSIQNEQ